MIPGGKRNGWGGWGVGLSGVLLTTIMFAAPAWGQGAQDQAVAEALFQEGRDLMKAGSLEKACKKFEASQELDPRSGTALNLAVCYEKREQWASSWAAFSNAASLAKKEGHADRERVAREKVDELADKYSTLALTVEGSSDALKVTLDGVALTSLGTPIPVDPGAHTVAANAPGKKTWQETLDAPVEATALTVTIPSLEDVETAGPAPLPPPPPDDPPPPAETDKNEGGGVAIPLTIAGFSVAGVGAVVGGITGAMAFSQASDLESLCNADKVCAPDEQGAIDDADTVATVSNISFIVGGVGLAAGVVGLVLWAGEGDASDTGRYVRPSVGPGWLGVEGAF